MNLKREADDVEFSVIDNLREMGKEALTSWGSSSAANETAKRLGQDAAYINIIED